MTLTDLAKAVHKANEKWWQDPATGQPIKRNQYELLALVVTELSEALEGERRGRMDDHLPHRRMAEVEMADAYIRLLDFCGGFGVKLSHYALTDPLPPNKGEAIFNIMEAAIRCANTGTNAWMILSLAMIRAYCAQHGYDLDTAMQEKMAYNSKREDHKHEARLIAGGKQF